MARTMPEATFTFNGAVIPFRDGQSIAAALTEAGQRALRRTAQGQDRGMFCGMGVCQDCLVTVNGTPNKRACMTAAANGLTIATQVAFPALDTAHAAPPVGGARSLSPDVLVIGGGAGGLSAAIAACRAGASVVVLDERKVAGGQYYKQSALKGAPLDTQQAEGATLLAEARDSGAEIIQGVEIWGAFDGLLFLAEHDGAALIARPKTAIVATGAYERPRMVPGWTLPGVMTTGAAQTLWRSYRTLPGQRVAVCGSGPLNVQVGLELANGGAEVALVAEAAPPPFTAPLPALRAALADPALTWKGAGMMVRLRRLGIPLRNRTVLTKVAPEGTALRASFAAADGSRQECTVDALCMNDGFEPQNEILRLLGARMRYDPIFGHLRCERDAILETSISGLFAVGDCAGLGGAPAAACEGRIAGRAAAARLGFGEATDLYAEQRLLRRHRAFQAALWRMYRSTPEAGIEPDSDTLVCRCEEITFAQLRAGLELDPGHVGTLKRATRVGMGRCQGRYCGPVAARLVARETGAEMQDLSYFAPRVPIKPVSISAILAAREALDDID
ncbi:FAD-dependent oxidoreductase [Oceanibium sediminis]|uniref:FAD-dependent oxidoreductase n=1 Tax=Oceanibium sediminis TaxID=2026339 RepID=UPI000DD3DF1A|nr:FAD-dependent oxidoreductase [Oceanibium sediminis]